MVTCSQYRYPSTASRTLELPSQSRVEEHANRFIASWGMKSLRPNNLSDKRSAGDRNETMVTILTVAITMLITQMGAYFNVVPQVDRHTRDEALEPVPPRDIEMASKGTFWGLRGLDGASGIL
ncbi:uncharacterized protein P884DRAFT_330850 [Thermothelomyces heterothallicus CBS 202.75]|uniref:uncharacterized protein n=1 Tax=Thermothelomyces heterothallicus CBS 202.75 TaxID=1149848 RepID=UPI0037442725